MSYTAYAFIGLTGHEIFKFDLPWDKEIPEKSDVCMTGDYFTTPRIEAIRAKRGEAAGDVKEVCLNDGVLTVVVVPFSTRRPYELHIKDEVFNQDCFTDVKTRTMDEFEAFSEEEVLYRLFTPKMGGKRPLILFLHGGGNGGTKEGRDNIKQLKADYGPVNFAEHYPDCYIMAPQCIEIPFGPMGPGGGIAKQTFMDDGSGLATETSWNRIYLAKVCNIIRRMVEEGKVDEKRIYVTGLSMGGAGTIRAMSVGAGLFTACAPVCPTMMKETYDILRTMKAPVWVSTAYVDHTIYRHKYITDAIMQLQNEGNKNAHLTLYSPEELAEYDIAITDDMDLRARFGENHQSWVLTYHDEKGIMSWLLNQVKE